ncbi:MAG: HAMP domain-containing sensor histidine kinase [Patescibacteria group bacterium]|jgi:signal transduction histidine kinase
MKGIHFLYTYLIRPLSPNEDFQRREYILNILLLTSIALTGLSTLSALVNKLDPEPYQGAPIALLVTIACLFAGLLLLSRKGHFFLSSSIFITIFGLAATYASYTWGTDLPWSLLAYALLIVMSGVLLGSRASLAVTITVAALLLFLSHLQLQTGFATMRYWRAEVYSMSDAFVSAILCLAIGVVSWLFSREIQRSLKRARSSEDALKVERDQLEIKVQERTRALEAAQLEKLSQMNRLAKFGRLAGGFFHDLMSPLSALSLNLEVLKTSPEKGLEDVQMHLEAAMKTTKRMEDFIFSVKKQIQNPGLVEYFSLNSEIHSALQVLAYRASQAKVQINLSASEEIHTLGSLLKFMQIVTNLLSNALDASDDPHVPPERRRIDISLSREDEIVVFSVRDQGVGIPPENTEKIFESFFSTKSRDRGMGIGLYLVKNLVENDFLGTITAESELGKGSTFTVRFPLVRMTDSIASNG